MTGLRTLVAVSALLLAGHSAPGHAADRGLPAGPAGVLGTLAAAALPDAELGRGRAKGLLLTEAASSGFVADNRVGAQSVTGVITNTNSVNNNNGLTTVFQNTGNNSLFQSSTAIYINIK